MGGALTGRVECHSGYAYAERPTAIEWQGQRLEVVAVETRWRTPAGPAFRVACTGQQRFELQYLESDDIWIIKPI